MIATLLAAHAASACLAVVLDRALGEPPAARHPVRLLGVLAERLERPIRTLIPNETLAGTLLAAAVVLAAVLPAAAISAAAWSAALFVTPAAGLTAGILVDAALAYLALSARMLAEEGRGVAVALVDSLPRARERVARLVARDTGSLDESGMARAAIESLAENTVDAVVAPLFWTLLGGGAGAWLHKSASTLDSMVGYHNERYARFGTASARLDDALAWLPARMAVPLIALAAVAVRGLDPRAALRVGLRDRALHASPNSAHGEAAFAGALGVRLGGESTYGGVTTRRPLIGDEGGHPPEPADASRAAALVVASASTTALVCAIAGATAAVLGGLQLALR